MLPVEENVTNNYFDFKKWRAILESGTELHVETPDCTHASLVSVLEGNSLLQ